MPPKGATTPQHVREKQRLAKLGKDHLKNEQHPLWKGDSVSYGALHHWLRTHFPKTGVCELCGHRPKRKKIAPTHYANISGEYRRDRNDYLELCVRCHRTFDREKVAA